MVRITLLYILIILPVLAFIPSPIITPYEAILGGPTVIINSGTILLSTPPVIMRTRIIRGGDKGGRRDRES